MVARGMSLCDAKCCPDRATCAQIVCKAAENADVVLRRSEKKVLNAINKAAHKAEGERPGAALAVRESGESKKLKPRISEAWEKSFVLVRFDMSASERALAASYRAQPCKEQRCGLASFD